MELDFLYWIQSLQKDWLSTIMIFITNLGNIGFIWILLGIIMLFFKKTRHCGLCVLIAMAISYLIGNLILKNLFARQRPFSRVEDIVLLIAEPSEFSFPSGHTLSSFTAATVIFLHSKKAGICAFLLAIAIAFSRMYLFVHYPSDIIAGMLLGIIVAISVVAISNKRTERNGIYHEEKLERDTNEEK